MMRKWILSLCALFLFTPFASAQFTNVTANPVQDPSGSPYVGCRAEADFVPAPTATTQPLINGSVFPTSVVLSQCDSFGNASWTLVDNNQVSDGHSGAASQWRFSITSQDGKTGFFCPITVTGANQNITAALQACAAPLPPTGGGGGNLVVKTLPCASSMIFTMAGVSPNTSNTSFFINPLNCNVTSSVVAPPTGGVLQKGAIAQFTFINDNVGGHSFAWPSNFLDQPSIQGGASPANCSTNTPPNCVTTNASFWYDGTQWHAQTFPAAGGGGGNPAGNQGTIQSTNGTSFSASNLSEPPNGSLAGAFKVNEDTGFLGPNPYVDIRNFGAVTCNPNTTPCSVGLTANTIATSASVSISSASTFSNGNGVVIYGAGNPHSMSTPSAPTVTPSVTAGPVNTLLDTAGPTGSTTYHYYLIARDRNGGTTAPSPVGTTTTGAASLGPQTVNITSMSRSGQVATAITAAHGLPTSLTLAPEIYIGGGNSLSDASFYGEFSVNTVPDSTHVTFLTAQSTALGATASATGGTLSWYNDNKINWSGVTGAVEYGVYSDRQVAGTCALIGVSTPTGANNDFQFDDFGQTFTSNQAFNPVFPASFPCASPPAATSDSLSTTISAGAGTTTLTLATAAGTTVSGATIRLDDAPGIAAAAASISNRQGTLYIPCTNSGNPFVINSWLQLSLGAFSVGQCGPLFLNDTLELTGAGGNGNGGVKWLGDQFPQYGGGPSVGAWSTGPTISVNTAHPGIYFPSTPTGQFALHFGRVNLFGVPTNGTQVIFAEASFNDTFDWINCASGSGAGDLLSTCFTFRQAFGSGASNLTLNYVTLAPGGTAAPDGGGSNIPTVMCRLSATSSNGSGCGTIIIPNSYSVHRGMFFQNSANVEIGVGGVAYINGGFTPLVTHYHGSTAGDGTTFGAIVLDTFSHPCLTNLSTFAANSYVQFLGSACGPSSVGPGNAPAITGASGQIAGGFLPTFYGNTGGLVSSVAVDSILNTTNYPSKSYNSAIRVGPVFPVFIDENALAAPTCSVSAGGSVPVGTATFQVVPVWQNNGVGNLSPSSSSCTTTTGNQTITINWSSAAGNPKDYRIYEIGISGSGYLALSAGALAGQTSYVWSSVGVNGGSFPSIPAGGPTMLMPGVQGLVAPTWTLAANGGFALSHTATLTANRAITWGDQSGTPAVAATAPITLSANGTMACPNCFNLSTSNNIGANFFDIGTRAGPGNPASGNIRLYADSTSGNLTCLTSAGANCIPGGGGGTPGGSTTQVQFNSAGAFAGSANFTWVSPTLTLGVNAATTGQVAFANGGVGGASVTIQNPSATSPYNFNLPTGNGSSGQPLLSGGGGSTAQSYGTLGFFGGGTGATSFTNGQLVFSGASTLSNLSSTTVSNAGSGTQLTIKPGAASGTALALDTQASPTGDIFDLNINGTKTSWVDSSAFIHTPQVTFTGTNALTLNGTNGTCPASVAGNSIICLGDSTTQMSLLSDNGGNFKPIAQFSTAGPTAHGVGLASVTAPQINFSGAGTTGQAFLSGGASADGAYGALNLAGGSTVVTGALPPINGGTGATSLAGANIVTVTGAITAGHCTSWNASTVVQDSGAACGGGSSPARLDQITSGTATNTINSTTFAQTWNWALTGSTTAFKFGENTAATGSSNILLQATTASASTAVPFQTDNNGNGYQLSSTGLWKPVGTGALATPGSAHNLVASQGSSAAVTYIPPVAAGKVLIDNGPGNDPSFQDPIVSQAFVNLWTAQDITATRTSANVRNPIFSQTATLQLTFAGITGSPATCTLQFRGVDSQGNVLNNGGTVSISPATGTSSQTFTAASTLQTAAQVSAVYACGTYPTAGTLTLDFTPIPNVNVTNTVAATDNVTQFGGTNISTGTGASGAGIPRVTISNDSSLAANQSVNVNQIGGSAVSTAATGVQKVGITGNAGAAMDAAGQNVAQPANELLTGCAFNTTPTTVTSGNMTQSQCDNKGNLLVNLSTSIPAGTNVIGALSANQSINVAQVNGNTTSTAATGVQKVGVVGNAGVAVDAATGAAPPANAVFIGGLKSGATGGFVTGITACDLDFNINISTATTTLAVTGVSGRQVRICSIHMVNNAADNVALIEGTGATCGTGTAGMAGGTTAASGYNFPANGGLTLGSGIGEVMTTATTGDSVCIVTSAATQLSGHIKYTIY